MKNKRIFKLVGSICIAVVLAVMLLPAGCAPEDENGEVIGGENMVIFNSEFIFPLSKAIGLRGAIFYDGGAGWDEEFRKWKYKC